MSLHCLSASSSAWFYSASTSLTSCCLFFSIIGICADGMSSRNEIPVQWSAPSLPSIRVSELRKSWLKFRPTPRNLPSVPENLVQSRVQMKTQRKAIGEPTKWRKRSVQLLSVLFSFCPFSLFLNSILYLSPFLLLSHWATSPYWFCKKKKSQQT